MRSGNGPSGNSTKLSGNSGICAHFCPNEPARLARAERCEQFLVQASEAAVAHDEHLIAGRYFGRDARDQRLDAALEAGARSQGRKRGG